MMSKIIFLVLVTLLGLISVSDCQIVQAGQCDPNVNIAANVNLDDFLGTWYEIHRSENDFQNGDCSTFTLSRTGDTFNFNVAAADQNFETSGSGTIAQVDGSGRLVIAVVGLSQPIEFSMLFNDPGNYLLGYSCSNIDQNTRAVYIWTFSRQSSYTNANIQNLIQNSLMNTFGISLSDLREIGHSADACLLLPDIDAGQPVILTGQCEDQTIPAVQNFNRTQFMGTWRLIESYHSDFQTGTCNEALYTADGVDSFTIQNKQVIGQAAATVTGVASPSLQDGSARFQVNISSASILRDYWVVASDYESYALTYSCQNLNDTTMKVTSWKFSRTGELSPAAISQINSAIADIVVLNNRFYYTVDRSEIGCFYFPTPDGNPVVFPNQCESIAAQSNFEVVRYLGTWFNIESYPQPFIFGTCNTANYDLGADGVIVFNTEVVNQTLSTITGLATVASEDGSAELLVTFPGLPGTRLWVLDTDYETYSLVYACQNIDEYSRQVISWKLSRTKTLSPATNTIINNVMNNIQVLDQRYFEVTDHSETGCFYYPEPASGEPVIFPGQCDITIEALSNFNNTRYAGIWHEIADYTKNNIPGECVNYEFTASNTNNMDLISRQVNDAQLTTLIGTVTRTSTDGSGRFTITNTISGNPVEVPYWVIDTDYDNYALAYGCRNVDLYSRQIFSWKLSRSKQLSAASNNAINQAMASIQVLEEQYYDSTDQSDTSCFYLPDLSLNEPVIIPGQCDVSIPVVQNFEAGRYLGTWRLIETYYSDFQGGACNEADYSLAGDGSVVVFNTQVSNETLNSMTGSAVVASDGTGRFTVTFPNAEPSELWVLTTDYDSYALAYSCRNINSDQRQVWSWKLSRTNTLTTEAVTAINQVVQSVDVLNSRYYSAIDRTPEACFYFPTPDGTPVSFPGQCSETISAQSNFDVERYLGTWFNIESYPQPFIFGTCNTANYDLGADGVIVFNTEVINQTLSTITGLATVASTDGSAELLVTFPGLPGTRLWVLDTDYETYSLVYACQNIDEYSRQVISWKLSRTKTLSQAANTIINNVMNNIQVLDQRYFEVTDHSETGCFYYPEPASGEPIIFPGQCDNTIEALSNFNNTRYAGIWHEIADYTKNDIPGECVNYEFTASNTNNMDLISRQVDDAQLTTLIGTVTRTSTDGSGRFTITNTISGNPVEVPYWVIDTDYDNYALAYGCRNVDLYSRQIFSWKLSRSKQLSAASNNAINQAMASIQVLEEQYYDSTDQSDTSCFYLPDLSLNEPVIIPGQCDASIPVVQNFEAGRYLGTWRLIETYYSDFQGGACNEADYSLAGDGSVVVFNTQVSNETLNSMTGSAVVASDGTGRFTVTFPNAEPSELWVLTTDYDSYALAYSCRNINSDQRQVWSWKLSRTNTLTTEAVTAINQVVQSVDVLNSRYYSAIDRTPEACFYFPTPDGTPVSFPGQCSETISAQSNFDVERYLGTWFNIESYPQPFIFGTCNTANYDLGADGVIVFNTEVINQTLSTITGLATVASTDGSAELLVTFPGLPGTRLWVLDTDYETYSLVYACQNIDEYSRQVISWKLSRTKTLSPATNTIINNVMNNIQVLDQRYFEVTDHSETGCFYYPEPASGAPIIFPGQCDNTIEALSNFNNTRYAGIWHEIADYTKNDIPGECVNYEFTASNTNNMDLISRQVDDAQLTTLIGTVTRTSTDGSGRFTITNTISGNPVEVPYWVIDTDYDNYALAYGCRNVDLYSRQIFSWKLSRSKQLSAASNNAINQAMASIQVLEEQYYDSTDQSDTSCFYLPDLSLNEPVIIPGQCDASIPVVQNFEAGRYLGTWRLIETYYSDFQGGACNEADYSLAGDGSVVVFNTQVSNETLNSMTGSAVVASDGTGRFTVTFPNAEPSELWVLTTDYDSYALAYSCRNINSDQRQVWSWKLSRTNTLTTEAVTAINQVVQSVDVLNSRYYSAIDRTPEACFYFPTPDGTPVSFPGQCSETISAQSNFDVERYLGTWFNIESYPQPFIFGTCNTANYDLGADGVIVFNTEVINQTLSTITGLATVASTDGSAELLVTFPGLPGTRLWVLDTDYETYSLVYACQNIDEYSRQVISWKLSRTKTLSPATNTIINNVMNNIQVLDQRYFEVTDHSETGCFYYPEPAYGEPVIFPGQCDNTIEALSNFNNTRYAGIWHEIADYTKNDIPGECVNYEFTASNTNNMDLISRQVDDAQLTTLIGTVTRTSTDGSGRFTITNTISGNPVEVPYWVIDTDYDNYALAYGCRNVDLYSRQIFSWKLSRSKQLSAASNNAINQAMASIQVLEEQYYDSTDQSDTSCFYLPDLTLNEPAIFPGQCDASIPVVQNFEAGRYLGTWRMIETYYSDFQGGACNEADYSLAGDGSVVVFNTQVSNETLNSMTGSAVVASDGTGRFTVTFPNAEPSELWVLTTDYDSYALAYSCRNINSDQRQVWSWKLSRTNTLATEAVIAINQVVENVDVLNSRYFSVIDRSAEACFYYPEPVAGQTVRFRGQCDENIAVVQNFELSRYMGIWYDIESYPQGFQSGTCAIAEYTLTDAGVQVYNTEVINQRLLDINGTAVPAVEDGSAKFEVSFPSTGPGTTPYWVLTTDYDNYALVYSCTNVDEYYRTVTSWKLSRAQTLSTAALNAIANASNNIQVLDQRYYNQRGHSPDDCLSYPENNGGPVVLSGQCNLNISRVNNFNSNQFSGTWHEISRFPSELQTGQCSNNQFVINNDGTFTMTHSVIINERLVTVTGTATADSSGVITADLSGSGETIQMTFNILDTDYTSFALIHSCRNLNDEQMQVYSWKLSSSKTGLSNEANSRIDAIVSSEIELFEEYYELTDQSTNGCFYYPEFDVLPSVITLPGPCDTTIQGVANFNRDRFMGTWYETARYPNSFQEGQCNRAYYTSTFTGFSLINENVVEQNLGLVPGSVEIISNDGSGLLQVTIQTPNGSGSANVFVLDTDYDNYAIIYTCQDRADGDRDVASWKFSRQKTMDSSSESSFENVIFNTQGLIEEYFAPTSQSDESCFYIPQPVESQAVSFRGQCDDITGMQGFDIGSYTGWWHEIERYSVDGVVGDCISSQYQANGNQFQVVDTSVFGLQAEVTTNTVTATPDGRLRKTLANGEVQDLWVLATDYETYSLVYSCENDGEERRTVWSAKYGKMREFTEEAQLAMAPVIEGNQVLYPQFYFPVNQADDACFHYPESTNAQVILPGQCNENIEVVENFDAVEYSGTWYQIEKYPQIWESGSCIGARYTLDEDTGVVNVLNWEVIDGDLVTIEGTATLLSDDGSAKLNVILPVVGTNDTTTMNLYVLDTDYVTYSVAYSCVNIDAFRRSVGVWKLSRQRTMDDEATTAINALILRTPELHQPYFVPVSHDDDCAEPSSAVLFRSSVLIMLLGVILNILY